MRRPLVLLALVLALAGPASASGVDGDKAVAASDDVEYHRLTFPVRGAVAYANDWGAPRGGGTRRHQGNDLMGRKLQPLVAAADGVVTTLGVDSGTNSGNHLAITDAEGWSYWYVHVNNDSPGTDDGTNPPEHRFAAGIEEGSRVTAGQVVAYLGDSGNAEGTAPHLHFEVHRPDGTAVNPWWGLQLSQGRKVNDRCRFDDAPTRRPAPGSGAGYWALTRDGGVFSYGDAPFFGSMGGRRVNAPVTGLTATPTGGGYWELAGDGGIFSFGDARFFGSMGGRPLNRPVVGMAATPTGLGYWLVASDGGIFAFGDAAFFGSTGGQPLNAPIIGVTPTPTGLGYWLFAADGGVFAFGDAPFVGSAGTTALGAPVVDVAAAAGGAGYWVLVADGRVLSFGSAASHGGVDLVGLCAVPRSVAIVASATGRGYWVQTVDGETWAFGDAAGYGSIRGQRLPAAPSTDLAAAPPAP